mgnify:FL=1
MQALMAVGVDRPEPGLQYNAQPAGRAWASLVGYLDETLQRESPGTSTTLACDPAPKCQPPAPATCGTVAELLRCGI